LHACIIAKIIVLDRYPRVIKDRLCGNVVHATWAGFRGHLTAGCGMRVCGVVWSGCGAQFVCDLDVVADLRGCLISIKILVQLVDLFQRVFNDPRYIRSIEGVIQVFFENGCEICLRGDDNSGAGG